MNLKGRENPSGGQTEKQSEKALGMRFRNHISIIAEQTGGLLIALLIVLVPSLLENIDELMETGLKFMDGKWLLVNLGLVLFILVVIALQTAIWSKTYISLQDNAVVIERNTLNKKKNTIGIRNISNINTEQNLFEMLLGTCKVKLDTNSRSTADSTDVKIILKKADALAFKQEVTRRIRDAETGAGQGFSADSSAGSPAGFSAGSPAGFSAQQADAAGVPGDALRGAGMMPDGDAAETEDYDVRSDLGDILHHGFFSMNILSVAVIILGIGGAAGTVFQIVGSPDAAQTLIGAASGILVAALIVASALWDTVKDFVRYYDFRAKRRGDKIYIRYGFLKKLEYTVPVDKIQALRLKQSFVARLGKRYMAEIVNVGMGDDKDEKNSFLILYSTEAKLNEKLAALLPEFLDAAGVMVERQPCPVWAAWSVPALIYTVIVAACAAVCASAMPEYGLWAAAGAAALEICLAAGMILKYLTEGSLAGNDFLKLAKGYFSRSYLIVRYRNIQYVRFFRNPLAKACGIRKGQIHLLASAANTSHPIPYFKGNGEEIIKEGMLR